jgi:type III pantothenate kinase
MYLLIDVGNTRIKWRLVTSEYDIKDLSHNGMLPDLENFIKTLATNKIHVLLAAVNQTQDLKKLLSESNFYNVTIVHSKSFQAGLSNSYANPERMGVDRWLGMIAAFTQTKKSGAQCGIIVVDAGSALTIDIVNPAGVHLGGYIVPGLLMAQQTLFTNTERIIQYEEISTSHVDHDIYNKLGNNTLECVEYGVVNQMLALVKQVKEEYWHYEIFFTGGDGELLASYLKAGTVDKDLVLKGLWQVRN